MGFDASVIQTYATQRGQIRATTDNQQHDVRAMDLDGPVTTEHIRRRAEVEAAWYIGGLEDIALADRQAAELVFCDAFMGAYYATARRLG